MDPNTVARHEVSHAHSLGIVHCDLKPGNVLLDQNGHVFVADFGFAFLITSEYATKANVIGGTAGYIAPEILSHESQPTPAADIYAIGVLLWLLATRDLPINSDSLPEAADQFAPLQPICQRCIAEDPGSRFSSMEEVTQALAAAL